MDLVTGDPPTSLGWADPQRGRVTREGMTGYTREATAYFEVTSLDFVLSSCKDCGDKRRNRVCLSET